MPPKFSLFSQLYSTSRCPPTMAPTPGASDSSKPASSKRKNSPSGANGRPDASQQKRAKMHAARSIPAQPADAALKDGELDLQAFVAAHEFEIRSLEQSMAASKAVAATRAFQKVPRGLRRRTASHNPKRVPRRLRGRARREMAEDNTPMVEARRRKPRTTRARIRAETAKKLGVLAARKKRRQLKQAEAAGADAKEGTKSAGVAGRKPRPKIRRNALNEPPKPAAKFRKRQMNKTWLPTHPWLAKRARMTEPKNPLWRFAIPMTPNEKIYRPTHRAQGDRGAMAWDMSYMSTIGLYGNHAGIERVLRRVGVSQETCWNDKGKKWRLGVRAWTGLLSREKDRLRRSMCSSTIFWNPDSPESMASEDSKKNQRQVFLRMHPSAFLEVFNELLRLTKMENPRLYIEDLRFEIGSIDLTGPASTEVLLAVLTPHATKDAPSSKQAAVFRSLGALTNPASLPANAVLGFTSQDPRLQYPPRKTKPSDDPQAQMDLLDTIASWPVEENLMPYALFDRNSRHQASCLPSQKSINRRRGAKGSGVFLRATDADPPIPIILHASRSGSGTQTQGTWTLLAPWKCILPFWYSIVHCPLSSGGNPRFGGLNELQQVTFERGLPWFPADHLGTDAGAEWELEQRQKRKWAWARRPKSKRVEWASLDLGAGRKGEVGDGLACDFEFIFGLSRDRQDPARPSEAENVDAMDIDKDSSASTKRADAPSLKLLHHISKPDFNKLLGLSAMPPPLTPNAIINVRVSLLSRGVVGACARVYRLPSTPTPIPTSSNAEVPSTIPPEPSSSPTLPHNLRAQWLARIPSSSPNKKQKSCRPKDLEARKRLLAQQLLQPPPPESPPAPNQLDIGGHPLVPDVQDLVGFVTAGSFSLAEGRGVAMGCLALDKVLPDVRGDAKAGRLCVVRNAGENVGWISRWEVI